MLTRRLSTVLGNEEFEGLWLIEEKSTTLLWMGGGKYCETARQ